MSRARRRMKSTTEGSSTAGSVSGCTTIEVTPPAAAARAADFSVSLGSAPGSPVLTRRSIRPGRQHRAVAVDHRGCRATGPRGRHLARDLGDARRLGDQRAGAVVAALRVDQARVDEGDRAGGHQSLSSRAAIEASTAMRAATPISTWSWIRLTARSSATSRVDLDAAVHRPRVHHPHARRGEGQLLAVEAEEAEVLARRGDQRALHPLQLQAQHHHHVGAGDARLHVVEDLDAPAVDAGRHQGRRPDQAHARAQHGQQCRRWSARRGCAGRRRRSPPSAPRSGRRRAACDSASSSAWEGCSCWPSPALITLQVDLLREQGRGARRGVPHHQDVRLHGVQRHGGVDQGLALGDRRGARAHVDHVGAQPLAGQLEASSGCAWRPRRRGSSACDP